MSSYLPSNSVLVSDAIRLDALANKIIAILQNADKQKLEEGQRSIERNSFCGVFCVQYQLQKARGRDITEGSKAGLDWREWDPVGDFSWKSVSGRGN